MNTPTPLILACPRCQQSTTWFNNPARPFCSERCKLIDLGAWANEDYAIPVEPIPNDFLIDEDE
jgi:endogenous inhibitor of DNA gyrase (YacG/DUF329 family)